MDTTVAECGTQPGATEGQKENGSGTNNAGVQPDDGAPEKKRPHKKNVFGIDRDKIETLPGAESQASELQNLGVDVISQEDFEKGVLDQVDQAISAQEEKAAKERVQRELDSIQTDIRLATRDLRKIEKILETMKRQGIQRNISTVQVQKQEKEKELKGLNKKKKSLMNRLEGKPDEESEDEDDSKDQESGGVLRHLLTNPTPTEPAESEQERLIRLGEMTPFEMAAQAVDRERAGSTVSMDTQSDFAQFLGAKDVLTVKKHVEKSKWKGSQRGEEERKVVRVVAGSGFRSYEEAEELKKRLKEDKFKRKRKTPKMQFEPKYDPTKEKQWKTVKPLNKKAKQNIRQNWESDPEISGGEAEEEGGGGRRGRDSDGSNFSDNILEAEGSSEDELILPQQTKKGKKKSLAEQVEDGDITCLDDLKASHGVKVKRSMADRVIKCQDDSTQDIYYKRLRANKRAKEKARAKREAEKKGSEENESDGSDDEPDDIELKGGLVIPGDIWNKLYRYQMTGVRWMWELHQHRAGGIMGDEMGLGKTIQMIAFLAGLKHSHLRDPEFRYEGLGPVIIICPATVMHQWVKEFHKWYPELRVAILHTSGSHIGSKATLVRDIVNTHSVLVTSYTTCRIQQELLHKFDWHYVILDEGHKIRNPDAEATLACKQFRTPHRLILTGSPLQNNLQELWSLFDFVFPGKLGTLPVFLEQFSVPITQGGYANATSVQVQTAYKCACVLRDTINPYLLRRMKADVQQNVGLPSKNEQVLFCRLTEEQKEIYKDYLSSRECHLIMKGEYQIFAGLITMRKICNHPHLVTGGPAILKGDSEESVPLEERYGHWSKAGKMVVVGSLLKIWKEQGHRVLLFSQGKQMLDIIESYVRTRYSYLRLDGGTGIASRQTLINRFNQNPSIFIFILTTRVGGLGVNLTGANRVIIYDPDWNPSTDSQARERAWRIGQKRDVTIYRLLTAGTIEEKIYHRQIYKHFLTNRVLKDPRQRRFFKSNDLFELFTLNDGTEDTETSAIFAGTGSNIKAGDETDPPQSSPRKPRKLKRSKTADSLDTKRVSSDLSKSNSEASLGRTGKAPHERSASLEVRNGSFSSSEPSPMRTGNPANKRSASLGEGLGAKGRFSIPKKVARTGEEELSGKVFDFKKVIPYEAGDGEIEGKQDADQVDMEEGAELKEKWEYKRRKVRREEDTRTKDKRKSEGKEAKRKRKKRKKDAKLEGVRITNLAKHRVFKSAKEKDESAEEEDKETHQKQDQFVLDKLFKKSGVHSALKHDNIMEASNPDYVLIENEASRVAKEAARALKESRQRCPVARSGVPTWTGSFGAGGGGMAKPRFGQKVNANLAGQTSDLNGTTAEDKDEEKSLLGSKKLFNGTEAAAAEADALKKGPALPSSSLLLAKMRARNQVQMAEPEEGVTGSTSNMTPLIPKKYRQLMTEVRAFISERARILGQASTDEILKNFQKRLSKDDTAVFRSMLRQVCKFERDKKGQGTWRLKIDYL